MDLNDEIERYKKQMMNLYTSKNNPRQNSTKSDNQGNVQAVGFSKNTEKNDRVRQLSTPIDKFDTKKQQVSTKSDLSIRQDSTKPQFDKGNYAHSTAGLKVQNMAAVVKNSSVTPQITPATTGKFPKPDTSYIERIAPAPTFPSTPDTGYIEAPPTEPVVPDTGYIEAPPTEPVVPDTGYIEAPVVEPVVPDTGYIEAPDFNANGEENGYLSVQVTTANRAIPIADAMVLVTEELPGGGTNLIRMLITDESGYTEAIPLPVPVYDLNEYPDPKTKPYRDYRVHVFADGYYIVPNIQVPIFSGVKSLQPVYLVPLAENEPELSFYPSIDTENTVSISQANIT